MSAQFSKDTSYNTSVPENELKLNSVQRVAYDAILDSVNGNKGKIFFIDAPDDTGKTFLINLLLAKVRSKGQKAVAVAFTGIAAERLDGGRTAHSTFELPYSADRQKHEKAIHSFCGYEVKTKLLKEAVIVFWDECNITNKIFLETANKILKKVRSSPNIMGGLTVVLSGDFRRVLPIIPGGSRNDFIEACLQQSTIWPHVKKLSLLNNDEDNLPRDSRATGFASLLLNIGNGSVESDEKNNIELNEGLGIQVDTLDELINNVYPDIKNLDTKDSEWLSERAIISPTNKCADEINEILLHKFQSESRTFKSKDNVVNTNDKKHYSQADLNSLTPYGLPPHRLIIKIGAPIMLLWNLTHLKLYNGTRLRVTGFSKDKILTEILTGPRAGARANIPKISFYAKDMQRTPDLLYADEGGNTYRNGDSPSIVRFKRKQYPVKLCFAITINKAHGQSFKCVGVDLREGCYSHGQLYVAVSRVGSRDAQFILLPPENKKKTPNIVYPEVLT